MQLAFINKPEKSIRKAAQVPYQAAMFLKQIINLAFYW